jgi:tRNA(Arg) A34 adenosine deaminase TadA
MEAEEQLITAWAALPIGARAAFAQQWTGLAAGGLPCGAAILDGAGNVLAAGRNHTYDLPGTLESQVLYPLQYTRLAHAEMNALALVPSDIDPATLTLWTTQHPCLMCAAAMQFMGMGKVWFVADDPSDGAPTEAIARTRGTIPYEALNDPLWWTISNVLFLYNSAVQRGANAGNLQMNRDRYPALVRLTLELAQHDMLGQAARAQTELPQALAPYAAALHAAARG